MIVRGIRSDSGILGISDNITVRSIVDVLEHSRIFWFRNGDVRNFI